ncbi:NAD(P)-dependent oxidoreductase [Acuticoccus kandeliae]|uniref:NAD(P)-dependent oxidoreductase n=1 Tax=Acuticoccus kandeliae TaxID=2073160 RepID=UPI000D3E7C84|nr:NAD(P)-binding domain-containing protein [Acuticoccus kandeliae]
MSAPVTDVRRVGLVGFGQVGKAIAGVLAPTFEVSVYDVQTAQCAEHPLVASGAVRVAGSASDLAGAMDLLLLCLPTPEASQAVAAEIADAVRPGLIVAESSTVAAEDVFRLEECLAPRGARVVDTAVIGGIKALSEGRAVFLVGATEADAAPILPVLDALAAELFFFDRLGGGMRAKLVANAVSHAVYVVLAEALSVAAAQDVPLGALYRLLARESGLMRPLTHRVGERLFRDDFAGGMSTANALKDSRLFMETAQRLKVPVFAIQAAHSIYEVGAREGMETADYAIIAKLWEKWADVRFAQEDEA